MCSVKHQLIEGKKRERCSRCGGKLKRETRIIRSKYKGLYFVYKQPGDWCQLCGKGFFYPNDLLFSHQIKCDRMKLIDYLVRDQST